MPISAQRSPTQPGAVFPPIQQLQQQQQEEEEEEAPGSDLYGSAAVVWPATVPASSATRAVFGALHAADGGSFPINSKQWAVGR